MKSISLIKVTVLVGVAAAASFAVSTKASEVKVSQLEQTAKASAADIFNKIDLDQNGQLTKAEVLTSPEKLLKDNFDSVDEDKNGTVDKNEFNAYLQNMTKIAK